MGGCTRLSTPSIGGFVMPSDKTLIDYSFIDYAVSCEEHVGVNVSDPSLYCNATFRPIITTYNGPENFTQVCCSFNTKCYDFSYPNTTVGVANICADNVTGYMPMSVVNTTNGVKVLCCNNQGANCYVDISMSVYNASTACNQNYTQLPVSVFFNTTDWHATCCSNGVTNS